MKWRIDLAPLHPEDAPALRRFAVVLERRYPKRGFIGRALATLIAAAARRVADRLDAGDLRGRP